MARAAATLSGLVAGAVTSLFRGGLLRPIKFQDVPVEIRIELTQTDGRVSFRITDSDANEVFSAGSIDSATNSQPLQPAPLNIRQLIGETVHSTLYEPWYRQFSILEIG